MRITTTLLALISFALNAQELPRFFDPGINNISLAKDASNIIKLDQHNCSKLMYRSFCFLNKQKSEMIKLTTYPGGVNYHFSYIEVSKTNNTDYPSLFKNTSQFATHKGIKLGLSKSEVTSILGEPIQANKNYIMYKSINNDSLLKYYNMPIYKAEYWFNNDQLVEFKFGFINP
ncbi:hypothetical protein C8D97_104109 [Pleionea mediterranea]|uniref:SmpA/OmlA family protein n=1 Tax=Pleionea mediterranea TaxID=523701 RepID=A0A316FW05_9GAMM|nr:hypothetical protein C8D97_104109 [Pleionea mediterranea]